MRQAGFRTHAKDYEADAAPQEGVLAVWITPGTYARVREDPEQERGWQQPQVSRQEPGYNVVRFSQIHRHLVYVKRL